MASPGDCSEVFDTFLPHASAVILTFDGDGYFAGAKAAMASTVQKAKGAVLFAVASSTHAEAVLEWFDEHQWPTGRRTPALVSVDPRAMPDVMSGAHTLSRYQHPGHHRNWSSMEAPLYRVFLRSLFPRIKRAVYVDADVVVQDDVAAVLGTLANPMALPISAPRSANTLKLRMDLCCQASKKVRHRLSELVDATVPDKVLEREMLEEFQQIPPGYREFNNGVMALDLPALEEVGVFDRLRRWLQLNRGMGAGLPGESHWHVTGFTDPVSGLFDNDQHAWNLAAWQHWQDLQHDHETNAPSLELAEKFLQEEKNPVQALRQKLRRFSFLHYVNQPKPWEVGWAAVPPDTLFDGRIWVEAYEAAGGDEADLTGYADVRQVGEWRMLRPAATADEHMDIGLLYMEGSGGMGKDLDEARLRFNRAAEGGSLEGSFMASAGLAAEAGLSEKQRLGKLEHCWKLARRRVRLNEDHQTLMEVYKMSEVDYLIKKAPAMVSICYWRLGSSSLPELDMSSEELEALFSPADGRRTPPLTPRLSKWMDLVARDQAKIMDPTANAKRPQSQGASQPQGPPVSDSFARVILVPALLMIGSGLGFVWRQLSQSSAQEGQAARSKNKARKGERPKTGKRA